MSQSNFDQNLHDELVQVDDRETPAGGRARSDPTWVSTISSGVALAIIGGVIGVFGSALSGNLSLGLFGLAFTGMGVIILALLIHFAFHGSRRSSPWAVFWGAAAFMVAAALIVTGITGAFPIGRTPACGPSASDLAQGRRLWTGDFRGTGKTDLLFDSPTDKTWCLGIDSTDAQTSEWSPAGNTPTNFGDVADGSRPVWAGEFVSSGKTEILFYDSSGCNFELLSYKTSALDWENAGSTCHDPAFGDLTHGHALFVGNFKGTRQTEILFYSPKDGDWHLGTVTSDTSGKPAVAWQCVSNTSGAGGCSVSTASVRAFGNLADGRPMWAGEFVGSGTTEVLFYSPQDGLWWLGTCNLDASSGVWSLDWTTVPSFAVGDYLRQAGQAKSGLQMPYFQAE